MPLGRALAINGVRFRAYAVQHSIRAPAVGYHVSAEGRSLFYLPDVAWLLDASKTLRGIDLYIGDGASLTRPLVRPRATTLIGHATIATQLHWCREAHVRNAVFSHCGSQIVGSDGRRLNGLLRRLGHECDVDARFACDGLRLSFLRGRPPHFLQPTTQEVLSQLCKDEVLL
jgi:ribonuclease BN (tRNA processing enzyme)